ncbi:MAG: NAD(P)H-binding protein [Labilithrix sp.]|nr:NAD(P)H-binding protein [Labilithrix sp.]MCW5813618.1 NAD(P)H-binding protein [Labilithrix sp.]
MNTSELHVVLGAGQVGPRVAQLLLAAGHRVRVVRQSATPPRVRGVEAVTADVRDPDAVARATAGASVVYSCVNPPYDRWPELLLPMVRGVLGGVARSGARLVALDNLYMYGDTARMHEGSPLTPRSKKGRLRAEAGTLLLDAGAVVARAADFFGPDTPQSILGEHFFSRVLAGRSAQLFGDPDQPHSYSYTPDVARGLVALGAKADARGVYMLPVQPAESTRAVVARFGRDIPISTIPTWLLRVAGVVAPTMRELAEMTYQWEQPFVLDDAKIRREHGLEPTPWDEAVATTLAWAETRWPAKAKGSSRRLRSAEASSTAR